jgi:hypothetical protein
MVIVVFAAFSRASLAHLRAEVARLAGKFAVTGQISR